VLKKTSVALADRTSHWG